MGEAQMHKRPRYGILGGTFDPPHIGHLTLAQEAYARLALDRVWFIPAGSPPHKSGRAISAGAQRRAMVARAIADDARFALSDIELDRAGPSYTVETLRLLHATWGADAWLCLIVGWDMLAYLPQWHDPAGVVAQVDQVAAAHRPGFVVEPGDVTALESQVPGLTQRLTLLPAPQFELAASAIRERVATGLPIRYLVPDAVRQYIEEQGLYAEPETAVGDAT